MMKNKVLKTIAGICTVMFIISASAIDSHSVIPTVISGLTSVWLLFFAIANKKPLN